MMKKKKKKKKKVVVVVRSFVRSDNNLNRYYFRQKKNHYLVVRSRRVNVTTTTNTKKLKDKIRLWDRPPWTDVASSNPVPQLQHIRRFIEELGTYYYFFFRFFFGRERGGKEDGGEGLELSCKSVLLLFNKSFNCRTTSLPVMNAVMRPVGFGLRAIVSCPTYLPTHLVGLVRPRGAAGGCNSLLQAGIIPYQTSYQTVVLKVTHFIVRRASLRGLF